MTIPPLQASGYLPPGDHEAALDEVEDAFGTEGPRRRELMKALREIVMELWSLGVRNIWIDGSFVGEKRRPSDVDVIYELPAGADSSTWGNLSPRRHDTIHEYRKIDLWELPSWQPDKTSGVGHMTIKQFMETDDSDTPKGHILLRGTT